MRTLLNNAPGFESPQLYWSDGRTEDLPDLLGDFKTTAARGKGLDVVNRAYHDFVVALLEQAAKPPEQKGSVRSFFRGIPSFAMTDAYSLHLVESLTAFRFETYRTALQQLRLARTRLATSGAFGRIAATLTEAGIAHSHREAKRAGGEEMATALATSLNEAVANPNLTLRYLPREANSIKLALGATAVVDNDPSRLPCIFYEHVPRSYERAPDIVPESNIPDVLAEIDRAFALATPLTPEIVEGIARRV